MLENNLFSTTKTRIKNSFNNALETYDLHCHVQKLTSKQLIHNLHLLKFSGNSIGDFGCGTGVSTGHLSAYFPKAHIRGIDIADKLLNKARDKFQTIKFIQADFDELVFPLQSLDLAYSNMALQWSVDLQRTLHILTLQLKNNGVIAFSIPLEGTLAEINAQSRNPLHDKDTILEFLNEAGFEILTADAITYQEVFANTSEAIRSLKYVGANCLVNKVSPPVCRPLNLDNGSKNLTYHIGFFVAQKRGVRSA